MSNQKLDELLGISNGIDDFLNSLSVDTISDQIQNVDQSIHNNINVIDSQLSGTSNIDIVKIENSLAEIRELIDTSKSILKHVHASIVTTDLCDSELIQAFSKLLEAAHLTISEYIDLYKNRLAFLDRIKFAMFQQEQKKELMLLKHKLDMEKMQSKIDDTATDAEGLFAYSVEDVTKMLNEVDQNQFS